MRVLRTAEERFAVTHDSSAFDEQRPAAIDTSRPHSARIWNYWLGCKDFYAVDREVGDEFVATLPVQAEIARQARVVSFTRTGIWPVFRALAQFMGAVHRP
jgi:hypothetical protein